ncbi:MAG: ABC transporter ATP-binding protein [bacterium]|nr:ABC transporter ATP-binding protein [bacterium]
MSEDYAIRVKDVKKAYRVFFDKSNTIKERTLQMRRNRYEEHSVLNGLTFDIYKGESVGLIGENGCGKSTTLKLLTKIIFPDSGTIEINGRVSSLLELGAGFHPDMSGRENIYTNAAIFGLKRKEIDERIDSIIEFSELQDCIDNPVRTYSSGMYMRLAFSVAINVNADILLIDEILAVGDVSFQKKCMDKIKEIKGEGTTIVLVSHSGGQIESICDKVVWLDNGMVKEIGNAKEINARYNNWMEERRLEKVRALQREKKGESELDNVAEVFNKLTIRHGNGKIRFTKVWLEDDEGKQQEILGIGNNFRIKAEYNSDIPNPAVIMSVAITRQDGVLCYATNNVNAGKAFLQLGENGTVTVTVRDCKLLSGTYMINVAFVSSEGEIYDDLQRVLFFSVDSPSHEQGICRLECEWQ